MSGDSAQSVAGSAGHVSLERYYKGHERHGDTLHPAKAIETYTEGLDEITTSRVHWYAKIMDGIIQSHGGAVWIRVEYPMDKVYDVDGEKVLLTGHSDLIVGCKDGVTIVSDWKFNFLEVPEAYSNIQLRGYVCLLADERPYLGAIHAVLVAGGNRRPFTAAKYTGEVVGQANDHITSILNIALDEDAPRIPSPAACKYCPARCTTRCLETLEALASSSELIKPSTLLPENKGDAVDLFEKAKFAKKLCDDYMSLCKAAVMDSPEDWEGFFELASTGKTRKLVDPQMAYKTLVVDECIMRHDEFMACISASIPKLQKAAKPYMQGLNILVKDHGKYFSGILAGNVEEKEKAPSLRAVKEV